MVIIDDELRRDRLAALMVAECDSIARKAGAFEVLRWPEIDDRSSPAVELIGRDAAGRVAVEHTVIESYPLQIAELKALHEIFPLGGATIAELTDAPQFRILLNVDEVLAIPRAERQLVEPAVADLVRQLLPSVPWPHHPGESTFVRGNLERPRLQVSLERWVDSIGFVGPFASVIRVGFWRPQDLESRRQQRLAEALDRKVPKLLAAEPDARTILVLEDRDMHMSAPSFVSRALDAVATAPLPDAIYLLNVSAGNPLLIPIYLHGVWWHEHDHGLLTFPVERAAHFNSLAP